MTTSFVKSPEVLALEEVICFFGSDRKAERELWIVKKFLSGLAVQFEESELKSSRTDPPDVVFSDCQFEVKEMMNQGRQRHAEYKNSLQRALGENQGDIEIEDVIEENSTRCASVSELCRAVFSESERLGSIKYPNAVTKGLDLVFYINHLDIFELNHDSLGENEILFSTKWRTVSFLIHGESYVLSATNYAPSILLSVAHFIERP